MKYHPPFAAPQGLLREPGAGWSLGLVLVSLFLLAVFYVAEPMHWDFSASEWMHLQDSEETTSERIESNIQSHEDGKLGRKIGMLVLGGFGLLQLRGVRSQPYRNQSILGVLLLVFLGWCAMTVIWSIAPLTTIRRLVVLLSLACGAIGVARLLTLEQLARVTCLTMGVVGGLGFLAELGLRTFTPWSAEYRFAGLSWPAFTCWCLSLFVVGLLCIYPRPNSRILLLIGAACVLMLLTKTRAGVAALAVTLLVQAARTWSMATQASVVIGGAFLAGSVLLGAAFAGIDIPQYAVNTINLGRAESVADISGRAGVWSALLPFILARPLHGYGYESFWSPDHLRAIGESNWGAPDAHNGYINLALGAGLIGSLLYIAILLAGLLRAWRGYRTNRERSYLFAANVLMITLLNSLFVAVQLSPYLMSFLAMVVLAHLGFTSLEPRTTES